MLLYMYVVVFTLWYCRLKAQVNGNLWVMLDASVVVLIPNEDYL